MTLQEQVKTMKKMRNDWGTVNPSMRIFKNKKKYNRKQKHKERYI